MTAALHLLKLAQENSEFRKELSAELRLQRVGAVVSPYVETEVDGLPVVQVQTDNPRSKAKIQGNKLLILWGLEATEGSSARQTYFPKWVQWAKRHLDKKQTRIETRKEWDRTVIDGFSVYDIEGKEEVAAILAKIQRDVQPVLREFHLQFSTLKESVAEGSLGFNRGARSIALNVRQKANPMKLRKYSVIMRTMIHEMAHLRHMNHGPKFQEFDEELLMWARTRGIYKPH